MLNWHCLIDLPNKKNVLGAAADSERPFSGHNPQPAHLGVGVLHQELELLVPLRRAVAARLRGLRVAAAHDRLPAEREPRGGVGLPGEAPDREVARAAEDDLRVRVGAGGGEAGQGEM